MKLKVNVEYFRTHGSITDPQIYTDFINTLPTDISELSSSINNLMLIDFLVNMGLVNVPESHYSDSQLQEMELKLKTMLERDNSIIGKSRTTDSLLLGNCRDLALLMCSVLRQHQIPARVRSGFATFFHPLKKFDHWVCEIWNSEQERWQRVDPWMLQIKSKESSLPSEMKQGLLNTEYNAFDVDEHNFYSGAVAWKNCRECGDSFESYGTYEEYLKGDWFVRDNMIRDLLCLVKFEPLPWDCWGTMGRENSIIDQEQLVVLDQLAEKIILDNITESYARKTLVDLQFDDSVLNRIR